MTKENNNLIPVPSDLFFSVISEFIAEKAIKEYKKEEKKRQKELLKKIDLIIRDCEEEGQRYTIELLEELKELA